MRSIERTEANASGIATFKRKKFFVFGGALLATAGVTLFFMPVNDEMIDYALSAGMVAVGLAALVSFLISRIETDDEGIQYKNMFGYVRRLRWGDILQVMDGIDYGGKIMLFGKHANIPVSYSFDRFDLLRDIILQKTGTAGVREKAKRKMR